MHLLKKIIFSSILIGLITIPVFSESYKISEVIYDITGKTTRQALERTVPVSKTKIFNSKQELEHYIEILKQDLINTRCFGLSQVDYSENSDSKNDEKLIPVTLKITVADNYHFLALPYLKYSSANGLSAKIKAKDTNFLGSMNELNTSIDFMLKPDEDGNPLKIFEPELNFSFDYPFKFSEQEMTWINDYSISYTWGENSPEWNFMTGLLTKISLSQDYSLFLKFQQSLIRDFTYRKTLDDTYLNEKFSVYSCFDIYNFNESNSIKIPLLETLSVTPVLSLSYSWDPFNANGTSGFMDSELKGPILGLAPEFSFGKVNWIGNYRTGISATITPLFSYNFASITEQDVKPFQLSFSANIKTFQNLNFMGINSQFTGFVFANNQFFSGNKIICNLVRGVIDDRYSLFANPTTGQFDFQGKTSAAFVLNLDLPVHIWTTDWENYPVTNKIKFMRNLNFEIQVSPFMDIALMKTDSDIHGSSNYFNPKDGLYGAGIEVLVFPLKWSSYVVRASVGIDLGRKFFESQTQTPWRNTNCKNYEISIGLGTFY